MPLREAAVSSTRKSNRESGVREENRSAEPIRCKMVLDPRIGLGGWSAGLVAAKNVN